VRLLPAYDQWVLGPGTADPHVVPPAHREPVSRGAAVVIVDGVVAGTWTRSRTRIAIDWFEDRRAAGETELRREMDRMGGLLAAG
jgi:hypothetical protein